MTSFNYVVYLTRYSGSLLPEWYIGSSSKEKVDLGYNGSVKSHKWKSIYKKEQEENKQLFKTRILSYHNTRKEAYEEELRVQRLHKVATNEKYINQSYAKRNGFKNGIFIDGIYKNNSLKRLKTITKPQTNGISIAQENAKRATRTKINKNYYQKLSRNQSLIMKEKRNGITEAKRRGEIASKTKKETGCHALDKNSNAKRINIYDECDNIRYQCYGNIKYICEENDMPLKTLTRSYKNKGRKIYMTKKPNIKKYEKYKGWYALEEIN